MNNVYRISALLLLLLSSHIYVFSQEQDFSSEIPVLSGIRYDRSSPEAIQKREQFMKKFEEKTDKRYNFSSTISWDNFIADSYEGGDGTPENPYQIAKPEQLVLLAQQTNDGTGGDACYILTNDIDLKGNIGFNWTPIGDTISFRGVFDGNNHTISNMYVERLGFLGLFGSTENAKIKNIIMDNAYITCMQGNYFSLTGVIAAYAIDTDISNCRISGEVITLASYCVGGVAGIVGCNGDQNDTIFIKDCVNLAKIFNGYQVGGIVGLTYKEKGNIIIQNCENYGELETLSIVGGIVAESGSGCIIRGCDNYGVIVDGICCGGILGQVNEWALVKDCINHESAEIHGNAAGGIVGSAQSGTIIRCGNRGLVDVLAVGSSILAGGIASSDGNFCDCYNIGTIRGSFDPDSYYPHAFSQIGGITGSPANSAYNVYNAGEIIQPTDQDIDSEWYDHISPAIRGINTISNCFWYGNEELSDVVFDMGSISYVEIPISSRFIEGTTATSWVVNEPQYGVDDLLEVLNAGTMGSEEEYVWREDIDNVNKGFPIIERITYDNIKEVDEDVIQLSIYPNPAKDYVKLSAVSCQLSVVRIFNNLGVLVSEMKINTDMVEIDVSNYRSGIYFIQVYSDDKVNCGKIVKL